MLDLRTLEIFYWVVTLGGFGRAAEKLHTTQPAVSARIAQMEQGFGVRLIERDRNRGITPTPKGLALLAQAERMLALRGEIVAALADHGAMAGTVRIGVSETIVHTWLNRLLRRLHDAHPHAAPDITVDISARLMEQLRAGEIDVALVLSPGAAPDVRTWPLCDYRMVWAAAPGLLSQDAPVDLAALASWPIITYARPTLPYQAVLDLFAGTDLPRPRLFASSSLAAMLRMAEDGIGVCVVPEAVLGERLRILHGAPDLPPLRFSAVLTATASYGLADAVADLAVEIASSPMAINRDPQ